MHLKTSNSVITGNVTATDNVDVYSSNAPLIIDFVLANDNSDRASRLTLTTSNRCVPHVFIVCSATPNILSSVKSALASLCSACLKTKQAGRLTSKLTLQTVQWRSPTLLHQLTRSSSSRLTQATPLSAPHSTRLTKAPSTYTRPSGANPFLATTRRSKILPVGVVTALLKRARTARDRLLELSIGAMPAPPGSLAAFN